MQFRFNEIPKFCISLTRCVERRDLVKKEFKKHNIDFQFFDAIDKRDIIVPELSEKLAEDKKRTEPISNGIYACLQSHLELYRKAASLRLPAICVLEDDASLCLDFEKRIKYIESLKNFRFDFFSLGGHFSTEIPGSMTGCAEQTHHNHIFKNIAIGGSYAYIITEKVYKFILRNATYNYGIDQFLSDVVYKRFNCFCFVPFLVGCRPCKSEITGAYSEYENIKYFYQQEAIEDLEKEYENPHEKVKQLQNILADKFREDRLKNE